jgi:hypothetical protein
VLSRFPKSEIELFSAYTPAKLFVIPVLSSLCLTISKSQILSKVATQPYATFPNGDLRLNKPIIKKRAERIEKKSTIEE